MLEARYPAAVLITSMRSPVHGRNNRHPRPDTAWKVYYPSAETVTQANIPDPEAVRCEAEADLTGYWARRAGELEWYRKWTRCWTRAIPVLQVVRGGKTNIVANALDRHVRTWRRNKLALIWRGEGRPQDVSYHALNREVCKFANFSRAWAPGREIGHDLHAQDSRNSDRHACPPRSSGDTFGRVRRLLGGSPAWAHRDSESKVYRHGRRRV